MIINKQKNPTTNITVKLQKLLVELKEEYSLQELIYRNQLTTQDIFQLLPVYLNKTDSHLKEKELLLAAKIAKEYNQFNYTAINALTKYDVDYLTTIIDKHNCIFEFLLESIESLKKELLNTEETLEHLDFDNINYDTINNKQLDLEEILNMIYELYFRKIFNFIERNRFIKPERDYFGRNYRKGKSFELKLQMNIRFDVLTKEEWLGGRTRNIKYDELFEELFSNLLQKNATHYCLNETSNENNTFIQKIKKIMKSYDIWLEGRNNEKIIISKVLYKENISIESFKKIKEEIRYFTKEYILFINFLKKESKKIRKIFDEVMDIKDISIDICDQFKDEGFYKIIEICYNSGKSFSNFITKESSL